GALQPARRADVPWIGEDEAPLAVHLAEETALCSNRWHQGVPPSGFPCRRAGFDLAGVMRQESRQNQRHAGREVDGCFIRSPALTGSARRTRLRSLPAQPNSPPAA